MGTAQSLWEFTDGLWSEGGSVIKIRGIVENAALCRHFLFIRIVNS